MSWETPVNTMDQLRVTGAVACSLPRLGLLPNVGRSLTWVMAALAALWFAADAGAQNIPLDDTRPLTVIQNPDGSEEAPPGLDAGERPRSATARVRRIVATETPILLIERRSTKIEVSEPIKEVQFTQPEGPVSFLAITPTTILLTGKGVGTTQMILTTERGDQFVYDVAVDPDLDRLRLAIKSLAPNADVTVDFLQESIVLRGRVPSVEDAERITSIATLYRPRVLNLMVVGGVQQVLCRVTFAEVARTAIRNLGVNLVAWNADGFIGTNVGQIANSQFGFGSVPINSSFNPSNGFGRNGAIVPPDRGGYNPFLFQSGVSVGGPNQQIFFGVPQWQIQPFITALRENNMLRTLAEPTLVALSGQEASFIAGGEFPFLVPSTEGNTFSVEFKEFGVQLTVQPVVLGQTIRLTVSPEVSDLDFANGVNLGGSVVPALTKRQVSTTVEMGNGQTLAVAGLLNQRINGTKAAVPGLGDVPVLGTLFNSKRFQKNETELLVLITPELVEPMNPDQVRAVPGQFMRSPNDWEFFGLSQIEVEPSNPGVPEEVEGTMPPTPDRTFAPYQQTTTTSAPAPAMQPRGPFGPSSIDEN